MGKGRLVGILNLFYTYIYTEYCIYTWSTITSLASWRLSDMTSLSPMSTPTSASTVLLPGFRPRGGSSKAATAAAQVWPSHVPLECGVIRLLLEKQVAAKQGGAPGAQQKFPISVSGGSLVISRFSTSRQ